MGIQINGQTDTISAVDNNFSLAGNVSIGGTLTYEDVTSVDAVGLSTFQAGIQLDDSITHLGDTDTKIRFPAADTVTVETSGSERLRVTSAGKVGVGINSPIAKLHLVEATEGESVIQLNSGDSYPTVNRGLKIKSATGPTGFAGSKWIFDAVSSGGQIQLQTVSTQRLTIRETGKIGINTDNPISDLHVITPGQNEDGTFRVGGSATGLGLLIDYDQNGNTISKITSNPTYTNSNSLLKICVDGDLNANQLVLKGNGKVGINESSPLQQLHVSSTASTYIQVQNTGDSVNAYYGVDTASAWAGSSTNHPFKLHTNNTERLRITSGGNVLIGTTTGDTSRNSTSTRFPVFQVSSSWSSGRGSYSFTTTDDYPVIFFNSNASYANGSGAGTLVWSVKDGSGDYCNTAQITSSIDGTPGNDDSPGNLKFFTTPNSSASPSERLRITSAGKVGIDNNNPNAKLEVKGSGGSTGLTFRGTDSSGNTNFWVQDGGSVGVHYYPFVINQDYSDSATPSSTYFYVHGSSPFIIKSDGKVGVGNASPARNLCVHDSGANSTYLQVTNSNTGSGGSTGLLYGISGNTPTHALVWFYQNGYMRFATNNTERLRIASDGKIAIGGNYANTASFGSTLLVESTLTLNNDSGTAGMRFSRGHNNATYGYIGTGAFAVTGLNNDDFGISSGATGDLAFGTGASGYSAKMKITNSGQVNVLGGIINLGTANVSSGHINAFENMSFNIDTDNDDTNRYFSFHTNSDSGSGNELVRITEPGLFLVGTTTSGLGRFTFYNPGSSGSDAGTAGQAGSGDVGMYVRSDMGPTHVDLTGVDNYTLQLSNGAYAGSGVSDPQGTITKLLFHGCSHNGWNNYAAICMDVQGTSGGKGDFVFVNGGNERIRVHHNGQVSVGTPAPPGSAEFTIRGANPELSLYANANYSSYLMMGDTNDYDNGYIEYDNYSNSKGFKFIVGAAKRLDISPGKVVLSQNMGVEIDGGTGNQSSDATVVITKTNNNDWALKVVCSDSSATDYGAYVRAHSNSSYALGVTDTSSWKFRVNGAGTIYAFNTTVESISDVILKENIVDANSQWDDIKALRFRNYKWKEDSGYADGKTYLGLIAQEVETTSPGLVEINAQTKEDIDNGVTDPEHKNVKYSIVWMKAMKALQEAMERIETLEAEVKALKG